MPGAAEPTVLVKKPDGTSVRMTLSELKAMQSSAPVSDTPAPPSVDEPEEPEAEVFAPEPAVEPQEEVVSEAVAEETEPQTPVHEVEETHHNLPMVEQTHALATTTPVVDAFVDQAAAAAHDWDAEDHQSPLEDAELSEIPHQPNSVTTDARVQAVMEACHGCVPAALKSRFEALITSHLKGIRTEDQLKEYFAKNDLEGGVGLTDNDIALVMAKMAEVYSLEPKEAPVKRMDFPQKTAMPVPLARPSIPVGSPKPVLHDVIPAAKPAPVPASSPLMQKRTTGPVDVLAQFSIIELRRIGVAGDTLAKEMLQKFEALKKESYMMYLDARDAWFHSPLFMRYITHTVAALNSERTLADALASDDAADGPMTMEEYQALTALHAQLHV